MNNTSVGSLVYYTPLRYPGGKGKLARFVKSLIEANSLSDCEYAEPYAGGAAIALELLFHEYVTRIHINDVSRPIYAFWQSVLHHTDDFLRLIRETKVTVASWDDQKRIITHADEHDDLALGFATFFLNRTNRSGILNGGIIGGRSQTGPWKIDARYNPVALSKRIEAIASLRRRISLSQLDARLFILSRLKVLPTNSLIYLDPPYYDKGKDLYHDYYSHGDHVDIAHMIQRKIKRQQWIVSYDNVAAIRQLYVDCPGISYGLGYSARHQRDGVEVMFFKRGLVVPPLEGVMRPLVGGARPKIPALRAGSATGSPARRRVAAVK